MLLRLLMLSPVRLTNSIAIAIVMVAEAVFTIAGFIFGQIRTLQRLGWLANISVWLNVIVIIVSKLMGKRVTRNTLLPRGVSPNPKHISLYRRYADPFAHRF